MSVPSTIHDPQGCGLAVDVDPSISEVITTERSLSAKKVVELAQKNLLDSRAFVTGVEPIEVITS